MTTYALEFITPAFLCGADQNKAELRAPSIRGELRWWFRALSGNPERERKVFGGVHGAATASQVVIRLKDVQAKHEELPRFFPMSDFGYIYYFASVSGNRNGIQRTAANAFFAPGTRFSLELIERQPLSATDRQLLLQALEAFLRLGTLGLRATRGCGALGEPEKLQTREEFLAWIKTLPSAVCCRLANDQIYGDWKSCQEALGGFLRQFRKENHLSGKGKSALGFSDGRSRESSALRLRPVKVKEGFLPVLIYSDAACSQQSIRALLG